MKRIALFHAAVSGLFLAAMIASAPARAANTEGNAGANSHGNTYNQNEIVKAVSDFFGTTTEASAKAVETIFKRYGQPNAYIVGSEGAGAFVVGLRYGEGDLWMKDSPTPTKVYWQGPSIGFDVGGNASKCFTLVYNLPGPDMIFQRFPGIEGSYYFIAGIGVNYQQAGNIVLAPMRTGVGLRAGVNAGYLSYSRKRNWLPF